MSSIKMNSILGALALASTAYAHGHVKSYTLNGQTITGGVNGGLGRSPKPNSAAWLANNLDNGFVIDPTSVDIVCHLGGIPGTDSLTVAAGETITMTWDQWPESHAGPVIDYLAPVSGDFASIAKASLQFTKIAEAGLDNGKWAALELIKNGLTWPVTIPADVAPGSYVLRHEILALHEGNRQGGTQFYPLCTNIVVTGSGTNALANGTPAQQLYKASDPGVLFDMYNNPTSYPIPGPKLLAAGGGSNPAPAPAPAPAPTTTSAANVPTSSAAAPTTTSAAGNGNGNGNAPAPAPSTTLQTSTRAPVQTSNPAPTPECPGTEAGNGGEVGATAAKYAQCGGINFTGPKACAAGLTCTVQNPYYSQCL